jgi:hypothetical protein
MPSTRITISAQDLPIAPVYRRISGSHEAWVTPSQARTSLDLFLSPDRGRDEGYGTGKVDNGDLGHRTYYLVTCSAWLA